MKNELEAIAHSKINNLNFLLVDIAYRKPHFHFDMEVSFILEGSGVIRTQDQEIPIKAGQGIIFNNCQVHEIVSEQSMKILVFQFSTTLFEIVFPQLSEMNFESQLFNLSDNLDILYFTFRAALSYFKDGNHSPLRVHGYTSLILDGLMKICNYTILNAAQQNKIIDLQERIQRISTFIHENYTDKISLDDLASREGFSRTYFSHFFKNNFGITFKEYLNNLRCEKARTLLSSTNENLLTISYICGFSDIRTLNNAFMKCYNVSPKDYRKTGHHLPYELTDIGEIPFNQDEIDNQRTYDDAESFDILHRYFSRFKQEQLPPAL
ncbi:helix-turn-helix domain-containing protein [Lactovum odontotermitis]